MMTVLVAILVGLGSVAIVLAITLPIISYLGGWSHLAQVYRCREHFEGKRWYGQDIAIGSKWFNYSGCVTVGANTQGLYLGIVFRLAHPPLFIPWSELKITPQNLPIPFIKLQIIEFQARGVPGVRFWFNERLMAKVAQEVGTRWYPQSKTDRPDPDMAPDIAALDAGPKRWDA
jgi:hypothetical protein